MMNSKQKKSYGYCAVCGKALSASEANDEYTQGKLCYSYANNPPEEPDYVNQKLKEAYPMNIIGWKQVMGIAIGSIYSF